MLNPKPNLCTYLYTSYPQAISYYNQKLSTDLRLSYPQVIHQKVQTKEKNYERGARIADRRKALGLSQDELAHRIGIGRQSLSAIENGGSFRAQTLDSLAVELEVSADFIMYGAGSTKTELVAEAVKVLSDMDEMQLRQCVAMLKAMMSV